MPNMDGCVVVLFLFLLSSRLNVFMQTGGKMTVGGVTVLCEGKGGHQRVGFPFENGCIIGGNFQGTYHGTTNWDGGRAAIGACK